MTAKALLREQFGRRILQKNVFLNSPEEFAAVAKEACARKIPVEGGTNNKSNNQVSLYANPFEKRRFFL